VKSIETHACAFLTLNIVSIGSKHCVRHCVRHCTIFALFYWITRKKL
jgi:hypothetical protein